MMASWVNFAKTGNTTAADALPNKPQLDFFLDHN